MLAALLRSTWRSVAAIITRVVAERAATTDRLEGLRRIGVDKISYRKGHRYLLCVVDHDTGRLVWAAKGRDAATPQRFFDAPDEERSARLTHISADSAEWIHTVAAERVPQAMVCLDAVHVVAWASAALDAVRRDLWNQLRRDGKTDQAKTLKNSQWALLKNPLDLTDDQHAIAKTNHALYRAYLLKEQLREIFATKGTRGRQLLAGWLSWVTRSRIPEFVALAKTIKRYLPLIHNTLEHGLETYWPRPPTPTCAC